MDGLDGIGGLALAGVIFLAATMVGLYYATLVVVYAAGPWIVAGLVFAPFAGKMYERAAVEGGHPDPHPRWTGALAAALLVVPWFYSMRRAYGGPAARDRFLYKAWPVWLLWVALVGVFLIGGFFESGPVPGNWEGRPGWEAAYKVMALACSVSLVLVARWNPLPALIRAMAAVDRALTMPHAQVTSAPVPAPVPRPAEIESGNPLLKPYAGLTVWLAVAHVSTFLFHGWGHFRGVADWFPW